jgi:oxygen-independent coproporphyrinogen-3 oxidase
LAKLDEHVVDGLAEIRDDAVVLMPQGYLMMRNVAMAFDAYLGCEQRGRFSRTV